MGSRYDVEKIEKLYRLGQLTVRDIAAQCKCSRSTVVRLSKQLGWARDMSGEVAVRTRAAAAVRNINDPTEQDINNAVQVNLEIINSHKEFLTKQKAIMSELFGELQANKAELIVTKDGNTLEIPQELFKRSRILLNLMQATKLCVDMERSIYNLDNRHATEGDEAFVLEDEAEEMRLFIKELIVRRYKRTGR